MLEAMRNIEEYIQDCSYAEYTTDRKTKDAVVRNLEILGEAATHVPEDVRARFTTIPWKNIIGLRNVVIHHYFGIDHATIWFIVTEQIPLLKQQVKEVRRVLSTEQGD